MLRKATKKDIENIGELVYLASGETIVSYLEEIQDFSSGKELKEKVIELINYLYLQKDTVISYENCVLYVEDEKVLGIVVAYSYEDSIRLIKNTNELLKEMTKEDYKPYQVETKPNMYYIDTVAVLPEAQKKGVGKQLLDCINKIALDNGYSQVSLLVDVNKANVKKLYEKKGYKQNDNMELYGEKYDFMVKKIVN